MNDIYFYVFIDHFRVHCGIGFTDGFTKILILCLHKKDMDILEGTPEDDTHVNMFQYIEMFNDFCSSFHAATLKLQ